MSVNAVHSSRRALPEADPSVATVLTFVVPTRSDPVELARLLSELFAHDTQHAHGVYAIEPLPDRAAIRLRATRAGVTRVRELLAPPPCDGPPTERVAVVPLIRLPAPALAAQARAAFPHDVRLVADEPTNSIVIVVPAGSDPSRIEDWIRARDAGAEPLDADGQQRIGNSRNRDEIAR